MKVLISACLLGLDCKYSGGTNKLPDEVLEALKTKYDLIPTCPESYGGLPSPRLPSERVGERVLAKDGTDVTPQYHKGARASLRLAQLLGCEMAILKEHSPSCGHNLIYDGTFTGTLIPGNGVTTELLLENGIPVYGENDIEKLLG